jgi:hypothetical protein
MFYAETKYHLFSITDIIAKVSKVNLGYMASGAPFNRRNFVEHEAQLKQSAFKRKLMMDLGYKHLRMLNLPGDSFSNRLKGLSISLRTNFKKAPNLVLSYTPYFQGNNHPDTLFRTNNQFSLFTSILTYSVKGNNSNHTISASYTNAKTEFFQLNNRIVSTRLFSGMYIINIQKMTISSTFQINRVMPRIDTVNFNSYRVDVSRSVNKKLNMGINSVLNKYQNNAFLFSTGFQANATLKNKIIIQTNLSVGKIYEMYEISDLFTFMGKLNVIYPLDYKAKD